MGANSMERRPQEHHLSFIEMAMTAAGNIPTDALESQEEPQLLRTDSGSGTTDALEPDSEQQLPRTLSQNFRSTNPMPSASDKLGTTKVSEMSSLLRRAGTFGLGKAVEALSNLSRSMPISNINILRMTTEGPKLSILAFEVANTIVRGANLMQSLSKENIKYLKEEVLPSEGVQHLISEDMDELLRIAASDKREELKVFLGEVARFGNRCEDPQWHNLDRYLNKLGSKVTPQHQLKEAADAVMQQLLTLVQYTAELYHEVHALDRFEQDYRQKLEEEENSTVVQRGHNLQILRQVLKSERKHVKSLKKKSLWSKNLEEVMEKLLYISHFLHWEIHEAFESDDGDKPVNGSINIHQRLGSTGLALHYANIISQIDSLVSIPSSVTPNTRDTLYQGLPPSVKRSLRSRLQSFQVNDEHTVARIKAGTEKKLKWLVHFSNNTIKANYGFGWVGEWANTGSEVNRKTIGRSDLIRIETLHYADKVMTEAYILDLVVWLHHLISNGGIRLPIESPMRSPTQKSSSVSLPSNKPSTRPSNCTREDQRMLLDVTFVTSTSGISKSQEFEAESSRLSKHNRLSKNSNHGNKNEIFPLRRPSMVPIIDLNIDRIKAMDVIDYITSI